MDHFRAIYAQRAIDYDAMISREDHQGNIATHLQAACNLAGKHVLDLGAGTGRLTRLVIPLAASVIAMDASAHMLTVAQSRSVDATNCAFAIADNRRIPLQSNVVDIALAGWSFGHAVGWYPANWQTEIEHALSEMIRVIKPGGMAVIFETMGTGIVSPQPPTPGHAAFYRWLENEQSFQQQTFATDYQFNSVGDAMRLMGFFFGDELANRIESEQLTIIPEFTGMWWRVV